MLANISGRNTTYHEYCVVQKEEVWHVNADSLGKYVLVTNCSIHITTNCGPNF